MLFENNEINVNDLPRAEEIIFTPLKPAYKTLLFLNMGILFLVLFAVALSSLLLLQNVVELQPWYAFAIYSFIGLLLICRFVVIFFGFSKKGYVLREHDIVYRTGLINRKVTAVPLNRIQHSEIRQSAFARMLGISKLKIFTAGGNTSDLSVNGLLPETAQNIKDHLSKTISTYE